jgi:hypothetical protein
MRRPSGRPPGRPPVADEIVAEIVALRKQHLPVGAIAEIVNRSRRSVESILYRNRRNVRRARIALASPSAPPHSRQPGIKADLATTEAPAAWARAHAKAEEIHA